MKKPSLLLGRNSGLVGSVSLLLKHPFELASHSDIDDINWSLYSEIFVFSWPKRDFDVFLRKINSIPVGQIIFISTTAVLSLQLRPQWADYPREKQRFENSILNRGGRIMRVGVTVEAHAKKLIGSFPFTSMEKLAHSIDTVSDNYHQIIDVFDIRTGQARGLLRSVSLILHQLSLVLPSITPLQMVTQGLSKIMGLKHYGYTADSNYFFRDTLQIGYGALGRCGPMLRVHNDLILTSPFADNVLNGQGFSNTRIGLNKIGLARFWHGVELVAGNEPGFWRKRVPLWISRSTPPKSLSASLHVSQIVTSIDGGPWQVLGHDNSQIGIRYWCRRLILAAGPISSAQLVQNLTPIPTTFSDHEIAMVGIVPTNDAINSNLVRRHAFFMYPGYSRTLTTDCGLSFLVEARPHVPSKHCHQEQGDVFFYLDSTVSITYKLLRKFDLSRINEAFFNKFGFSFFTQKCSIFVQVLAADAIKLNAPGVSYGDKRLYRERLTKMQWQSVQNTLYQKINNFYADPDIYSVDGQHILGGASLIAAPQVTQALEAGRLVILGSPTLRTLDERHHTCSLQRETRATSQPLLLYLPPKLRVSGCHDEHVTAIAAYANPWKVCIASQLVNAFRQLCECRAVFFQKTALSNLPVALLAVWLRIPRVHYLHEPLSVFERRKKGVPLFKAVMITFFQVIEIRFMTRVLTGNPDNKVFSGRKLIYAPLLLSDMDTKKSDWLPRKKNLLYFGRLDQEKYFDKFMGLPLENTVIATSNLNVKNYVGPVLPVSYEEKKKHFESHRFVWCVQKNSLTQSGVVIDAIKFGCCCILRRGDPICEKLHPSAYIEIPSDFTIEDVLFGLCNYNKMYPTGPECGDTFSQLCGQHIFDQYWRPHLI